MSDEPKLCQLESMLGHEFNDRDLLMQALTHASLVEERLESNERLEFLGDVVLGLVVCQYLFEEYEDYLEGELTKIKSSVVSRKICAEIVRERGLQQYLRLGKGLSTRGSIPESVLAAVYEALIGALYLDAGLERAQAFILGDMREKISSAARTGHQYNFKSVLQQAAQQEFDMTPQYLLLDEQGPDHCKCFEICVTIGPRRFASAWGPSKKQSEQRAALEALLELGYAEQTDDGEIEILPAARGESRDADDVDEDVVEVLDDDRLDVDEDAA